MSGKIPEGEIYSNEDPCATVNLAFKAAHHVLKRYTDKLQRKIKTHAEPFQGKIISIGENFGHIKPHGKIHPSFIYFHEDALLEGNFNNLGIGDPVYFSITSVL